MVQHSSIQIEINASHYFPLFYVDSMNLKVVVLTMFLTIFFAMDLVVWGILLYPQQHFSNPSELI